MNHLPFFILYQLRLTETLSARSDFPALIVSCNHFDIPLSDWWDALSSLNMDWLWPSTSNANLGTHLGNAERQHVLRNGRHFMPCGMASSSLSVRRRRVMVELFTSMVNPVLSRPPGGRKTFWRIKEDDPDMRSFFQELKVSTSRWRRWPACMNGPNSNHRK